MGAGAIQSILGAPAWLARRASNPSCTPRLGTASPSAAHAAEIAAQREACSFTQARSSNLSSMFPGFPNHSLDHAIEQDLQVQMGRQLPDVHRLHEAPRVGEQPLQRAQVRDGGVEPGRGAVQCVAGCIVQPTATELR